jgi:Family of unknown function (DUF6064)
MQLPFTTEQFYDVFRAYNTAVWPAQLFLVALAIVAVVFVAVPRRWSGVGISAILAFLWAWIGCAYHLAFFTAINPLAYVFAGVSLIGAAVFLWQGVIRRSLEFRLVAGIRKAIGLVFIVFALMVYPAWSYAVGHRYPALPTFGLPCPTTIFTVGMLAFLVAPYPRSVFVVPILWCFVGTQAAFLLGVPQDLGLGVAGVFGIVLFVRSRLPAANGSKDASASLKAIKVLHTIVWAIFVTCILAIPVAALLGEYRTAALLAGVVAGEVAVLAFNKWRCPLTAVAARHTDNRQENFDIYLPLWLATYNKHIFGALYVAGVAFALVRWACTPRG